MLEPEGLQYGFIVFSSVEHATKCLEELNELEIRPGVRLYLGYAAEQDTGRRASLNTATDEGKGDPKNSSDVTTATTPSLHAAQSLEQKSPFEGRSGTRHTVL